MICCHTQCSEYLTIMCSDCNESHPKHDNSLIKNFKKFAISIAEEIEKNRIGNNGEEHQNMKAVQEEAMIQAK